MFLATTALSEFWNKNVPILFLGKWCQLYSEKKEWEKLHYRVMDYPWDDREKLEPAYIKTEEVFELILPHVAEYLNRIHQEENGTRYWRIVMGDWLWRFIQVLYDRYTCAKQAIVQNVDLETFLLSEEDYIYPTDTADFLRLIQYDRFNLQLYSEVLRRLRISYEDKRLTKEPALRFPAKPKKRHLKEMMEDFSINRLKGNSKADVILCHANTDLSVLDKLKSANGRTYRQVSFNCYDVSQKYVSEGRTSLGLAVGENEFFNLCAALIMAYLPVSFVEGYGALKKKAVSLVKRSKPKIVISYTGWRFNALCSICIAEIVKKGGRLWGVQHGGGYGIYELDTMLQEELKMTDTFVSWGWSQGGGNVLPLPQPDLSEIKRRFKRKPNKDLLFIGATQPRYQNTFHSAPLGPQNSYYIDFQLAFFKNLTDEVKKMFIVRNYPQEFGWYHEQRLKDAVPGLRYDNFKRTFFKQLQFSRLVVCDNTNTPFLQTLGLNIPTLLFWDTRIWTLHEQAKKIISRFEELKIFHDSVQSAAQFLNENHGRIEEWWGSDDVQTAVGEFNERFSQTAQDWEKQWHEAIKSNLTEV